MMATCRSFWYVRKACRQYGQLHLRQLRHPRVSAGTGCIHTSPHQLCKTEIQEFQKPSDAKKHLMISKTLFEDAYVKSPDKETFLSIIESFESFDKRRRGHIQFIETALVYMKRFKVEKDVECYNRLLDVFPKGIFAPKNKWQAIFVHFPDHQMTGIKVLQQMEDYKVIPNGATREILISVFGKISNPVKKYQRLMYWFPKFRHINPFPLPEQIPDNPIELAKLGLKRMSEFEAKFEVISLEDGFSEEIESNYIAQVQSEDQKELLAQHPPYRPLYVEGPYRLWLRDRKLGYFILRCDPLAATKEEIDPLEFYQAHKIEYPNQDTTDNTVYAMCVTDRESRETLRKWVETLQDENPHLKRLNIVFNLFEPDSTNPEAANMYIEKGTERLPAE